MKSLFEQFGGTYRKESDYLIPNLKMLDAGNFEIGTYGQQHLNFLKHFRRVAYINLLTNGNLNEYLAKIDSKAQKQFELLVTQMKNIQGISEQLKVDNPMEWFRIIKSIRRQADEIVLNEMIYQ